MKCTVLFKTKTFWLYLTSQLGFLWFFVIDGPTVVEALPFPIVSALTLLIGATPQRNTSFGKISIAVLMFICVIELALIVLLDLFMLNYGMG